MIFLPSAKFLYRPQLPIAPWTPLSLGNTVLYGWYKADAGVPVSTDGASVATWADQSTNNNDLAQANTANRGVFRTAANGINGIPVLEFAPGLLNNSTHRSINDTAFLGSDSDGFSFYIVSRNLSSRLQYGGAWMVGNPGAGGISQICDLQATGSVALRFQNGSGDWVTGDAHSTRYSVTKISCGSSLNSYKHKATYIPAQNQPNSMPSNTIMGAGFSVGSSYFGSVGSQIAEVIVCNKELDATEEASLDAYFRSRYGFGLYYGADLPVASPALWLDASRSDSLFVESTLTTPVTTDNGSVGGWKDLSGNNRHALQSGTNRPTWRTPINGQNGLGVMSFNGTAQWLDVASFPSLASGYTFYGVIKQPTAIGAVLSSASAGVDGSTAAMVAGSGVTAVGTAQISTTQSKFSGGSSGQFDGSTSYLSLSGNSSFQFGTGDFTVEMWVYISANAASQQTFLDIRGGATASPFTFGIYQSKLAFYDGTMRQTSATVATGQWYHVAACRSGGTLRLFVDGISYYSAFHTTNFTTGANSIYIGRGFDTAAYYFNGHIDDLRIKKGVGLHTSTFTPPAAPLPDTPATDPYFSQNSLLLHMDGTNGSTVFTDSSNNLGTGITQGGKSLAQAVASGTVVGVIGNYDGTHTAGNYFVRTSSSAANVSGIMTQTASTPATGTASIGRLTNATAYFNSQIYELVVLPRQSNGTEDQAWKDYTAAKWGVTWS